MIRCFALLTLSLAVAFAQSPETAQKKAQTALDYQVKQIGKDCPNANSTLDSNICLAAVLKRTETDFATFFATLTSLLDGGSADSKQLRTAQDYWKRYAKASCEAIDAFYHDGTIHTSAELGCEIQLKRSRMQDLNALYYDTLHN
jgi:uncharacterized protein YecT (DUF1311 family)